MSSMKRILTTAFALCLMSGHIFAGSFSSSAQGTTAAEFLQLGVGGRAMGLSGAYTAVADDAGALYWNPAGLAGVEKRAATFMHAAYLQSSFYDYAAYAQANGLRFDLYVRVSTQLSGPLTQAVDNGLINLLPELPG